MLSRIVSRTFVFFAAGKRDRETIIGLFGQLTDVPRSSSLRLVQSLLDANQARSEIEQIRNFGED